MKVDISPSGSSSAGKPKAGGGCPIYDLTPFTMLDYPETIACIIWLAGCNMRCGYCHNPQIVRARGRIDEESVLDFLKKRQGLLGGVVLSGGEATTYHDLPTFARKVKALGYKIKLDTNGCKPKMVETLVREKLVDYIALDYKAPEAKFKAVTGINHFPKFRQSLAFLCTEANIPFEVRTTVHTSQLDEEDLNTIVADLSSLGYKGTFHIQNFRCDNARSTLGGLTNQTRLLQKDKLASPTDFKLNFRNFA